MPNDPRKTLVNDQVEWMDALHPLKLPNCPGKNSTHTNAVTNFHSKSYELHWNVITGILLNNLLQGYVVSYHLFPTLYCLDPQIKYMTELIRHYAYLNKLQTATIIKSVCVILCYYIMIIDLCDIYLHYCTPGNNACLLLHKCYSM